MHMYICVLVYVCIYVNMNVCMYVCMYLCMYICVCAYKYVCMYIWMYVDMYVHLYSCLFLYAVYFLKLKLNDCWWSDVLFIWGYFNCPSFSGYSRSYFYQHASYRKARYFTIRNFYHFLSVFLSCEMSW